MTLVKVHGIINSWPKYYEVEAYRQFESDEGQKSYSSLAKTWKTNSTVIKYTENNCSVCRGRVKIFLKLNGKAICVCDKLEETFDNVRFNRLHVLVQDFIRIHSVSFGIRPLYTVLLH